ncbi:Vicinal oxygen chelate (VOC) domain [Arabidopsis thaliana x Arabidopsis arenosa]|uniref:Vicinal oxygen chelate (VOC) domain n=1 Tax=Arabidopsis thaliana x Arabidopsis arenosa TaxID=1240361 RepID=A0A8T1ZLW4_9BRAS|nr:Vicinal oxygen chelate (VOC) domain [Arabidopsis thaliana x Arabidopsis arenosa]
MTTNILGSWGHMKDAILSGSRRFVQAKNKRPNPLNIVSLNHVSLNCHSVEESKSFYEKVLGFIPVHRPGSLTSEGAWLSGFGIGIHLLCSSEDECARKTTIDPKDKHISFQCNNMIQMEKTLKKMDVSYLKTSIADGEIQVDQVFFHDPDGFMIEICSCGKLPVIPLVG